MLINYFYKIRLKSSLQKLARLQKTFFACYFKRDYLTKQFFYEKIIHQQRLACLHAMQKMPQTVSSLMEIIFSLHQLRHRIKDYTIFEVCERELKEIERVSTSLLTKLTHSQSNLNLLLEKIHLLERIYHNTLRIVTPDPIVFLFFIQDLYSFHQSLRTVLLTGSVVK